MSTSCDGTQAAVIIQTTCTVTVQTLEAAPFNLITGSNVLVYVIAANAIGNSPQSPVGSGAIVKLSYVPNAPTLSWDSTSTTKTQVGVTWADGYSNGGQAVIDYSLSFDSGTNGTTWTVLAGGILTKSYVVTGLATGKTYKFKLQSRNSIGLSGYSNVITATAAIVPAAPNAPSTVINVNNVIITWNAPSTQSLATYGSAITGY